MTFCNDFGNDAIKMSSDHKIKMKVVIHNHSFQKRKIYIKIRTISSASMCCKYTHETISLK